MKILKLSALIIACSVYFLPEIMKAQTTTSQMFRLSEGFVRIAEPGQITDTLSVWGDISAPGRYLVPRGTKVHELISYARGPIASRTAGQNLDWSKVRVQISISRNNVTTGEENVRLFTHRYDEPYPAELRDIVLRSDDLVSVEVLRKPAFVDWLRVFSTVASATATTIIVVDRLSN